MMGDLTPVCSALLGHGNAGKFNFELLFDMDSTNQAVYDRLASPIVNNVVSGYNGTLFAYAATRCHHHHHVYAVANTHLPSPSSSRTSYGQTSSGKTHTIMGDDGELGIMFLALQDVFSAIDEDENTSYAVTMQYLEIYNEVIRDLLDPKKVHTHTYTPLHVHYASTAPHSLDTTLTLSFLMLTG